MDIIKELEIMELLVKQLGSDNPDLFFEREGRQQYSNRLQSFKKEYYTKRDEYLTTATTQVVAESKDLVNQRAVALLNEELHKIKEYLLNEDKNNTK